ncbi:MAG: YwaF family protein [Oscillospiraceae bacterium]|nr:YwaF family protein [Oscillospiraceae bacterium]
MNPHSPWIIRPFNGVFCACFALFLLLLALAGVMLRGKSERTKKVVLVTACVLTLLGFFVYKYFLSIDAEFHEATAAMGGFNWWGELPLQLCNINMILIPIAVLTNRRALMSFCFFVGSLGAMMALVMPGAGFDGYSILLPRMLGYYGTHFMVIIEALALAVFGLYRPRFRDLPGTVAALVLVSLAVFGVNVLLRATGLHPKANYFFSMETEGNPVLELFYRFVPYPWLYELPSILILLPYMLVITAGFAIAERKKK